MKIWEVKVNTVAGNKRFSQNKQMRISRTLLYAFYCWQQGTSEESQGRRNH